MFHKIRMYFLVLIYSQVRSAQVRSSLLWLGHVKSLGWLTTRRVPRVADRGTANSRKGSWLVTAISRMRGSKTPQYFCEDRCRGPPPVVTLNDWFFLSSLFHASSSLRMETLHFICRPSLNNSCFLPALRLSEA